MHKVENAIFGYPLPKTVFASQANALDYLSTAVLNSERHRDLMHANACYGGEREVVDHWKITNLESGERFRIAEVHNYAGGFLISETNGDMVSDVLSASGWDWKPFAPGATINQVYSYWI